MSPRILAALAFHVAVIVSTTSHAGSLPVPSTEPVLTITGLIAETNRGDAAVFDMPMLERLAKREVETSTPWHNGRVRFEGVALSDLMAAVGAKGGSVTLVALNDYVTTVPRSDFEQHSPILAFKQNGEYMKVRDKGPLFIIYPFDSKPELKADQYYARSVWQVKSMKVEQ